MKILANLRFTLLSSYLKPSFPSYSSFGLFQTISYGSTYFFWSQFLIDKFFCEIDKKQTSQTPWNLLLKSSCERRKPHALGLTALGTMELSRRKCFASEPEIIDCAKKHTTRRPNNLENTSYSFSWFVVCVMLEQFYFDLARTTCTFSCA